MINRTNYTQHDKIRDRLWLHDQRRRELVADGYDSAAASRIAFHEVKEREVRVAWIVPGRSRKYLNPRKAAQMGNELGVKIERCIHYIQARRIK